MSLEAAPLCCCRKEVTFNFQRTESETERGTLSRNNGRHSVSGKAKKEGRGFVEEGDDIILGYVEVPLKSNQHMQTQQRSSLSYNKKPPTF